MASTAEKEILAIWAELGPVARHIFKRIGERMAEGHKKYGDFPVRSWRKEAAEEALDMIVYLTAELEVPDLIKSSQKRPKHQPSKTVGRKTSSRANR